MDLEKIKAFVKERFELHESFREESEAIMDDYWNRLSDFIASDVAGAIDFMCNSPDCTGEIFADWSEVFDDVVRKSQSKEFVDALPLAAERFRDECKQVGIACSIECARDELN